MNEERYTAPESRKELIKSGTFLNCYCPHCKHSLNSGEEVVFIVVNAKGERGELKLSPYLNVFKKESTIYLKKGEQTKDLICPHCQTSLVVPMEDSKEKKEDKCHDCDVPAARILVAAVSRIVSFYICLRVNCHWHGLTEKDETSINLDESKEW